MEEQQLALTQRLQELSNHFNNLLAGILGNAQLLEAEKTVGDRSHYYITEIKACAKRATELTRGLSELVTLDALDQGLRGNSAQRTRVLIIDDEDTVRSLSAGIIARSGFEVLSAADGVEGIEQFEKSFQHIRCVFLDLSMPYMRGNLVFARLRAIDASVPIFVMSGHSESYIEREFSSLGIAGLIRKPFQAEDLLTALYSIGDNSDIVNTSNL